MLANLPDNASAETGKLQSFIDDKSVSIDTQFVRGSRGDDTEFRSTSCYGKRESFVDAT